jgi:hypothetical protein
VPRPMCLGPHPLLHIPPCQADQRDPMEYRWDWGAKAHSNRLLAHQFFAGEITRFTDFYPILLGLVDYRPKLSALPELFFPGRSSLEILRSRTGIEVGLE